MDSTEKQNISCSIKDKETPWICLNFNTNVCEHGDGMGTDVMANHVLFNGINYYEKKKESFFQGVQSGAVINNVREFTTQILKNVIGMDFDSYYFGLSHHLNEMMDIELYNIFIIASYHSIYAHTTYCFGLKDLFKDHCSFLNSFISKYGIKYINTLFVPNKYDHIISNILNEYDGSTTEIGRVEKLVFIEQLCNIYENCYLSAIIPDIKVLASLYLFTYFGVLKNLGQCYYLKKKFGKNIMWQTQYCI